MRSPDNKLQKGAALLAILLVFVVSGSALLLGAMSNSADSVAARQAELSYQMQQAKIALLAYAASVPLYYNEGPGQLPCPDTNNNGLPGEAELIGPVYSIPFPRDCSPAAFLGRLPRYAPLDALDANGDYQKFPLSDSLSGIDQQFWYAVSPQYLHSAHPAKLATNSLSPAELRLDDQTDIVALIIAPGPALETGNGFQDRTGNPLGYQEYLDPGNGANFQFWTYYSANPALFNDRVLAISRRELLSGITPAVARTVQTSLNQFHSSAFFSGPAPNSYPEWLYTSGPVTQIVDFNAVMNDFAASHAVPDWYGSAGEDWHGTISYQRISDDHAVLQFGNCSIAFDVHFNSSIERSRNDC